VPAWLLLLLLLLLTTLSQVLGQVEACLATHCGQDGIRTLLHRANSISTHTQPKSAWNCQCICMHMDVQMTMCTISQERQM
jgi:hypothetical protein